jgi:hypothetical protein
MIMRKVKKPISIILSLLILLSVFTVLPFTANAKDTEKSKTGGMFPTITLTNESDNVTILNWEGVSDELPNGVAYDKSTTTLTLDNFNMLGTYGLETTFMGEDFKLEVKGECSLDSISMSGGCLSIIGDGNLTVGGNVKQAVYFEPFGDEYYPSALNIDENVSVKFSGTSSAVVFSKSSAEPDKVMTAGGKKVEGLKADNEYQDGETKKIYTANLEKDSGLYNLATVASDPDGTYCECGYYDEDLEESFCKVIKCTYDENLDAYIIDDSFEPKLIDYDEFDKPECEYRFARDDGGLIWIDCYKWNYDESEVYQDDNENTYAIYDWNVYDYSDDNVIKHDSKDYYVLTRNNDVGKDDLTPVIDKVTARYYDYSYEGADYEFALSKRGKASGIYLDTAEGSLTLFEKFNDHCDSLDGVSFDSGTHTLSINDAGAINNLSGSKLVAYYMGDDFTISVDSDCELGGITVYNGSLTVAGEAALTVNSDDDYGITVEPFDREYNASSLKFADSVTVNAKGKESAFCVKNTTLDEYEAITNADDINKSNDTIIENDKKVSGGVLSSWSDGMGYRYKVLKDNEPDSVYCARGYSRTDFDDYGNPKETVNYYEMKKCHYDEKCDAYIIDESLGTIDQGEFDSNGYHLIERENAGITPYITMSAYYLSRIEATAYVDSEGKNFAVSGESVYSYSEEKLVTLNGNDIYLFESASDVDVNTLTVLKENSAYRTYSFNGTEFRKEKVVETSEVVTNPVSTEPEGSTPITTQPGGNDPVTTDPASVNPTKPPKPSNVSPELKVNKKSNPITVTVKKKTVKIKKLKKMAQKVKAITVKNAQGKVAYKLVKSGITKKIRKFVKINSKGVITIKKWKKAKKGTYKIKVKITAAGTSAYNAKTVTKTVKVKIK